MQSKLRDFLHGIPFNRSFCNERLGALFISQRPDIIETRQQTIYTSQNKRLKIIFKKRKTMNSPKITQNVTQEQQQPKTLGSQNLQTDQPKQTGPGNDFLSPSKRKPKRVSLIKASPKKQYQDNKIQSVEMELVPQLKAMPKKLKMKPLSEITNNIDETFPKALGLIAKRHQNEIIPTKA